jgi:hypothetical protein
MWDAPTVDCPPDSSQKHGMNSSAQVCSTNGTGFVFSVYANRWRVKMLHLYSQHKDNLHVTLN